MTDDMKRLISRDIIKSRNEAIQNNPKGQEQQQQRIVAVQFYVIVVEQLFVNQFGTFHSSSQFKFWKPITSIEN